MREKIQADEMKKIAEDRKRQKMLDQQARNEVLDKIKQDKSV